MCHNVTNRKGENMLDFVDITYRVGKKGMIEIYPIYRVKRTKDLMVKGKSFYAIWDEKNQVWSTDEYDVQRLIDEQMYIYKDEKFADQPNVKIMELSNFNNKTWTEFQQYVKSRPDSLIPISANAVVRAELIAISIFLLLSLNTFPFDTFLAMDVPP